MQKDQATLTCSEGCPETLILIESEKIINAIGFFDYI